MGEKLGRSPEERPSRIIPTGVQRFDVDNLDKGLAIPSVDVVIDQVIGAHEEAHPFSFSRYFGPRRTEKRQSDAYKPYRLRMPIALRAEEETIAESVTEAGRILGAAALVKGVPATVVVDSRIAISTDRQTELAQSKIVQEAEISSAQLVVNVLGARQPYGPYGEERIQMIKDTIAGLVIPTVEISLVLIDQDVLDRLDESGGASMLLSESAIFVPTGFTESDRLDVHIPDTVDDFFRE